MLYNYQLGLYNSKRSLSTKAQVVDHFLSVDSLIYGLPKCSVGKLRVFIGE